MPQQQTSRQGRVFNSATNPSILNNNNNRHVRTTTARSNRNNTSISLVNTNFQIPPSNTIIGNEKNGSIYQQQYQQEQFGNHVINRQHGFHFVQPQMSVQYSNTNVPFQNHQNTSHVIESNVNIDTRNVESNNMSPTTQSYFQSLPPEEFREIFLKKAFLGEDPSIDVSNVQQQPALMGNNSQHVIPSSKPSSPPNVSQQHVLYNPNVQNSPVTSPTSNLIMQQQLFNQQSMQPNTSNASNNDMALLPPQHLENLTEQQLMEYILTWMTSVKTTN